MDLIKQVEYDFQANPSRQLPLKGVMIGSGLFDPQNQLQLGENLFQCGLVDIEQRILLDTIKKWMDLALEQKNFTAALQVKMQKSTLYFLQERLKSTQPICFKFLA